MKTAKNKRKSLRIRALSVCLVAMLAIRQAPSTPPAVHVIRTINTSSGDTTLPTVLAAVALAIALTGAAYVTLRLRPVPRSS